MARTFLALVISLFIGQAAAAETPRDPYTYFFNETFGDFTEELQLAKDQGKKGVFIFFEMDECPFCHYMKQNVLNQPKVQEYYRDNFLNFSVDIEGDIEIVDFEGNPMAQKEFAFKNRVRATPVLAFFNLDGERIHRHTGRTSGVDEFMLMGRFVAEDHYKEKGMYFSKFKRANRN